MNRTTWLKVSLALNTLLLAATFSLLWKSEMRTPATPPPGTVDLSPPEKTASRIDSTTPRTDPSALPDWKQWISMNRSSIPSHVLAAMVQADFDQRWQMHQDETYQKYLNGEIDIDSLTLLNIEREIEQEKELLETMGAEKFQAWDKARQFFDINLDLLKLSDSETDSFYQLRKRLHQQFRELEIAKQKKEIDQAAYDEQREKMQADYEQQARALLGFERFRTTQGEGLSADLKRNLRDLNVTAEQLGNLETLESHWMQKQADLQRDAEQGYADLDTYEKEMAGLRDWRNRELQRTLGTNAVAFYERQQDSRYVDMKNFGAKWGVNDRDIELIYSVLKEYDQATRIYQKQLPILEASGNTVKRDEVKATLQKLSTQTAQTLREYLGPERFDTLKRNSVLNFN
jgi:hypothetical protein